MSKIITTENFIQRAKEVHGDRYDYSKAIYINQTTPITIICSEHGEFLQAPVSHWGGANCHKCSGTFMNTEYFKEKAAKIHNNKYDYSKTIYVHNKHKMTIICPVHGEWQQDSSNHLQGKGCPKCVEHPKGTTTETFIQKLRAKHGDKYDYSKVVYEDCHNKITIICPVHGEFNQKASNHLRGDGCPKCTGGVSISQEDFLERARKRHGDKYDYSKVIYVNSVAKVIIGCPIHGDFPQSPTKHISSTGCPKCGGRVRLTTEEFIEKARKIHGDIYDYSKVVYVKNSIKVTIICPEHGEFQQQPNNHLLGKSCLKCAGYGFEYASHAEAKQIVKQFGIRLSKDYFIWWKANEKFCRAMGLPFQPHMYYLTHK